MLNVLEYTGGGIYYNAVLCYNIILIKLMITAETEVGISGM